MADFNKPLLTDLYVDMVDIINDRNTSTVKWLDGTTDDNLPNGAKRWNSTNNYFEKLSSGVWSPLAAKYMIDVDTVDGCTVNNSGTSSTDLWTASKINTELGTKLPTTSYTAADILTKIKTVDGSSSGLDADLLDGLHASSSNTASTIVARDASGNFRAGTITANLTGTASTATTLTGLTSTIAELNFSDGVTSNIQTQLNSKAPLLSPAFTGTPTAPTATTGNNSTQIATTEFVAGAVISAVPVSTIIALADDVVPTGFLECNGATISRSTYSALFSKIGTTYGAGDGSTTFKIPDLRGEFIRGWDHGRGIDSGRAIGSNQSDAYGSHTHSGSTNSEGAHTHNIGTGDSGQISVDGSSIMESTSSIAEWKTSRVSTEGTHSHTLTINASGSTETRPRNIAMIYCIKY